MKRRLTGRSPLSEEQFEALLEDQHEARMLHLLVFMLSQCEN